MLRKLTLGGGQVVEADGRFRLTLPATSAQAYADAQLDDYGPEGQSPRWWRRGRFTARPPIRVALRARASHAAPAGTLGFGFWNDPFTLAGGVLAGPKVVWFFYASPPSDMALVDGVPGRGWKAATLDSGSFPGPILAPAALAAVLLTKVPGLGRPIMAAARRVMRAHEALLSDVDLTAWHTYALDWRREAVVFTVDGQERLRSPAPPRGPLGFVAWIDNQYAIASRAGQFGFGLCAVPEEQWLELDGLRIERGAPTGQ